MKTKFNRFAILPHMCDKCQQYIWLESYRRSDVFHNYGGFFWKENICKDCIKEYGVK